MNAGRDHDSDHKVDWQKRAAGAAWVTGVAITSDPGNDGAYARGDVIQVTATFSKAVNVDTTSGTPRLKIRMAPYLWWLSADYYEERKSIHPWLFADNEDRWADYSGGSGTAELTFDYTVLATNRSTQGVAVLTEHAGAERWCDPLNGCHAGGRVREARRTVARRQSSGGWHDASSSGRDCGRDEALRGLRRGAG